MTNLSGTNLNNGAAVGPQGESRESPSSFPAYPTYKDSGVEWLGEIPGHWAVFIAKRMFGNVRESASADAEQLAATQAYGVIPQKDFMERNDAKVVLALSGTENFRAVKANDFVISLRSFQGGIEHSAYDGCVSPAYTVLRRKDERNLNPSYLRYLFKDASYISALQSVTTGIREGRTITYEQFGSLSMPVAPVAEQTQIARFLDHETARIDALIEEQQRLIELLKEKRQAVISHAVTKGLDPTVPMKDSGVEWLGEVPAHWDVKKVGHACDIHNNLRTPIDREIRAVRSGVYPYYGPTGVLDYIDDFYVEGEYFLIGEDGDHFLKFEEKPMTFLVDGKFCVNNHAHLVRGKDDCATSWAALYFEARDLFPWLIRQGVGRYKLRKEALVGISITVPPKSEQLRIVDEINSQKAVINRVISESEQSIKEGLNNSPKSAIIRPSQNL
jgi:type I restriction enzyme, S subunit